MAEDLKKPEREMTKTEQAFSIYYNCLIEYVLNEIIKKIASNAAIPKFEKPIPLIVSGGTTRPHGKV